MGCLSVVVLFLIFVLVATAWFFYVTREVEVHDEDLIVKFENVPDDVNGYFALDRARALVDECDLDTDALSVTNNVPSDENLKAYRLFLEEHPDVLNEFYSVTGYQHCRKPINEDELIFTQDIMPVSGLITLGNLSLCHVEFLVREGRNNEALDCLVSHLRIGQMVQNDSNNLLSGMLGLVVHNQSLMLLVDYLSNGVISKRDLSVLDELLVDVRNGSDWHQMIRAEYSGIKALCSSVIDLAWTNTPPEIPARMIKFVYNESLTVKATACFYRDILNHFDNPDVFVNLPMSIEKDISSLDVCFRFVSGNCVGYLVHAIATPSVLNIGVPVWKQKSLTGLVELYLASWKYYDERSELPSELSQLVPEYLPELPTDPYGDGKSFLYDSEKKEIYSAGVERSERQAGLRIRLGFVD